MFPYEYYYAKLPSGAKKELLDNFRAGQFRVIIAIGAFGTGIDIDDIHLVVHVDEPWDMMDYGQTSGRGGRDGQYTQAIIIRGGIPSTNPLIQQYMDPLQVQCRRVAIDKYLDGDTRRVRCVDDKEACDWCEQQ